MTRQAARRIGWVCLGLAVGVAALCNLLAGTLAVLLVAALVLYELQLKDRGMVGHAAVSAAVACTFLLGVVVGSSPLLSYPLPSVGTGDDAAAWWQRFFLVLGITVVAYFANLGRELLKAVQDLAWDTGHRSTYAVRVGPARAVLAARRNLLLALLVGSVVFLALGVDSGQPIVATVVYLVVAAPFVLAATRQEARTGSRLAKLGMAIALVGFVALVLI